MTIRPDMRGPDMCNPAPEEGTAPVILPGNAQDQGKRREQQDAFTISDPEHAVFLAHAGLLAVVADGMGGMKCGGDASLLAADTMLEAYAVKRPEEPVEEALLRSLHRANRAVLEMACRNGVAGDSGTTLVAAAVLGNRLWWISAGDSRLYLARKGELLRLTEDHVYATELDRSVLLGRISPEEALFHPEREALTSFLGLEALPEVDRNRNPLRLEAGDRLLLCSDGLYKFLPQEETAAILCDGEQRHPQVQAERLVEATLRKDAPGQDNITVVVLGVEQRVEAPRTSGHGGLASLWAELERGFASLTERARGVLALEPGGKS
jgi:protein phosphatase